jgi:hypothetical protein
MADHFCRLFYWECRRPVEQMSRKGQPFLKRNHQRIRYGNIFFLKFSFWTSIIEFSKTSLPSAVFAIICYNNIQAQLAPDICPRSSRT